MELLEGTFMKIRKQSAYIRNKVFDFDTFAEQKYV